MYAVFSLRTGHWPKCPPQQEVRRVQIAFEIFSKIIFISQKSTLYRWIEITL